ncbi:hypothetical protein GCM10022236_52630 [Microlunatus ginsengisoli]|uniref:Uncharacterized protein n=1 Tax=Microlunatus ginsengisoli TaxID=363863 RepID=A0ABP7AZE6_9ACTN
MGSSASKTCELSALTVRLDDISRATEQGSHVCDLPPAAGGTVDAPRSIPATAGADVLSVSGANGGAIPTAGRRTT